MKCKTFFQHLLLSTCLLAGVANPVLAKQNDGQTEATGEAVADNDAKKPLADQITSNVAGSYLSSRFARDSGDIGSAIMALQRVHDEEPDNITVALQLQGMLLVDGRIDSAIELAEDIDTSGHKDPLTTLLLALREIQEDDAEAAASILDNAADVGSTQLWLPLMQSWTDVSLGRLEKPVTVESINSDIGRAAPLVNYHLALINSKGGFKDEAAKNFKNAIQDPAQPPQRVMRQLLRFYDQNDAPEQLAALVKEYRESNEGEDKEADIENDGNTPVINTARDGVAEILYTMGGIMFGAGVANDAAIYLQLALYVKPDLSEAMVALGDTYSQMRQEERANAMYARVPQDDILYSKAQLHIAVNHERMGHFKEAISLLDGMAKHSPQATEALVTKGDLLRIHGHYKEAVEAYSLAIKRIGELKPMFWPLLFARGSSYERQGKWPLAEKDLQMALELKPDQPDVLNYLGFAWLERGTSIEEARDMIARAVKARPDDAQIVDSMGWALYIGGDYTASISYLEKAVELLPGDPTVNDHLGDVYWRLGRKNEARFQWDRALSFSPEAKLAQVIQNKLKDGLPPSDFANSTTSSEDAGATIDLRSTP